VKIDQPIPVGHGATPPGCAAVATLTLEILVSEFKRLAQNFDEAAAEVLSF
jgi:hypothetical protein